MPDIRARTSVWKGLNRAPYIADGEMRSMKNLCSDAYPYLTTRKGRTPYKFDIFIPSPEGEAYRDIEKLPEPCMEEMENVYKLTESYKEDEYVSGAFYYYNAATQAWVQGIKDTNFLGDVTDVIDGQFGTTLYSDYLGTNRRYNQNQIYAYTLSGINNFVGKKVRYLGADTGTFNFNKIYEYKLNITFFWSADRTEGTWAGEVASLPTASADYFCRYVFLKSESRYYLCIANYNGYWEEVEDVRCEIVAQLPDNPSDGMQIRYIETPYGIPVERAYYQCQSDVNSKGEYVYFYITPTNTAGSVNVTCLPAATEKNVGTIYYYNGIVVGQFAKCDYLNGEYKWVAVSHPKVRRTVTIAEYITDYKNIELGSILEIAAFEGKIAVIFTTKTGENKPLYNEQVYDVNNMTLEPGKKLSIVGNKLVVGESGAYLHIKDGATTFFKAGSAFSTSVWAECVEYGNGGGKYKTSSITGSVSSGKATFILSHSATATSENAAYKAVAEGLAKSGTNFSVTFNGKTYYLTSESVTYEPNYNVYGYRVGDTWYYQYAAVLTITATGVKENFSWSNYDNHHDIIVNFASTDPHYYDVVAWKKRLWGYDKNIVHGTVSDIFASSGIVDWVTGNNTYLEAISQPIWQGGNITGLAALSNALILFKEDSLTVFTGNYPAIMSGSTIPCRGLNAENRESVAVGNEAVFYLSQDGVYRFTGGIPQCISRDIKIKGTEAVGASDGNKYWLSLKEADGTYALYVYDANLGIWHKEDNTRASSFTMLGGEMYMTDVDANEVYNINTPQEDVEWELELWFDEGTHKKKKYKEFIFRGNVGECELQLKADDGEWQAVRWTEDKLRVRIEPFVCEELGLRLKGKGICEIKTLDRVYEEVER